MENWAHKFGILRILTKILRETEKGFNDDYVKDSLLAIKSFIDSNECKKYKESGK